MEEYRLSSFSLSFHVEPDLHILFEQLSVQRGTRPGLQTQLLFEAPGDLFLKYCQNAVIKINEPVSFRINKSLSIAKEQLKIIKLNKIKQIK